MMQLLRILVNQIDQTQLSHFESLWAIESRLKETQNDSRWLNMTYNNGSNIGINLGR